MKVCTTPLPWIVGLGIGWATAFTLPSSLVRLTPLQQQQSFSWKPTTTIQRYATIPEKGQDVENKVVVRSSSISSLNKIAIGTAIPYEQLTIGILKEDFPGENRVSQTPDTVAQLVKAGFSVVLQAGGE